MKKYILGILLLLGILSCVKQEQDSPVEDYEKLFPFTGIDRPEAENGKIIIRTGDPNMTKSSYKYPGVELPADAEKETYTVTIKCKFNEVDSQGQTVYNTKSKYVVRYIDKNKKLKEVHTEDGKPNTMDVGEYYEKNFKVSSGFPIFLSVNGNGPRNSSIEASIRAVSSDGLIEVPILSHGEFQDQEGQNSLKNPYCEYIILP